MFCFDFQGYDNEFDSITMLQQSCVGDVKMNPELTIEVFNAGKASIQFLKRFFGSAGDVSNITRGDDHLLEFKHKRAMEKAKRLQGRVLDQKPLKIAALTRYQDKNIKINQNEIQLQTTLACNQQSQFETMLTLRNLYPFVTQLISKDIKTVKQNGVSYEVIAYCMVNCKISEIKYLHDKKVNRVSDYVQLALGKILNRRLLALQKTSMKKKITVIENERSFTMNKKKSPMLPNTDIYESYIVYPSKNEEEPEFNSKMSKQYSQLVEAMKRLLPTFYAFQRQLQAQSRVINIESASTKYQEFIREVIGEPQPMDIEQIGKQTQEAKCKIQQQKQIRDTEDIFWGIIENYGSREIFFEYLNLEESNLLIFDQKAQVPMLIHMNLHLKYCRGNHLIPCSFASYLRLSGGEWIEIDEVGLSDDNLIFQGCHYTLQQVLRFARQYSRYYGAATVFYVIKGVLPEVVEDESLELFLIRIDTNKGAQFEIRRCENYLRAYIQDHVEQKNSIIANEEVAMALGRNILEQIGKSEWLIHEGIPLEFDYIGRQLWRIYQNRRKRAKRILLECSGQVRKAGHYYNSISST